MIQFCQINICGWHTSLECRWNLVTSLLTHRKWERWWAVTPLMSLLSTALSVSICIINTDSCVISSFLCWVEIPSAGSEEVSCHAMREPWVKPAWHRAVGGLQDLRSEASVIQPQEAHEPQWVWNKILPQSSLQMSMWPGWQLACVIMNRELSQAVPDSFPLETVRQ